MAGDPAHKSLSVRNRPSGDRLATEEPAQVFCQVRCRGVAIARILLKALETDSLKIHRHSAVEPPWRQGIFLQYLPQRVHHVACLKWRPASCQAIENCAQRINVRR